MVGIHITRHAIEQYRARVVRCCDRTIDDAELRVAIRQQIEQLPWRGAGLTTVRVEAGPLRRSRKRGNLVVDHVTHTFVIDYKERVLKTVLGFMMKTTAKVAKRKDRQRRLAEHYERMKGRPKRRASI